MYSRSVKATINLFINWLLDLTLIPGFNQAIMGFTRPLWILLGHNGSAIMGSPSHVIKHRHECSLKGNNKHSQLIIADNALVRFA